MWQRTKIMDSIDSHFYSAFLHHRCI